jgi:hypothetical protein
MHYVLMGYWGNTMRYFMVLVALFGLSMRSTEARDFGYEKFADVVSQVYGNQYGVVVPFFEMPDATDVARQAEGYPGSIWNFAVAKGRSAGTIYTQADQYCNPNPAPAPLANGTTKIRNWLYRSELSAGGDFTVTGATPTDVVFQLTALDAKYIDSYAIEITNTKRYYLPFNTLKDAVSRAVTSCGPNFAYALTGVLAGEVTIKVFFVAGVSSSLIVNIGSQIKANLHLKAEGKLGESESNPVLIFTEGQKAFAVRADRLPLR